MITTSLVAVGTWVGTKLLDKGFDSLYEAIVGEKELTEKFYAAVDKTSKQLQVQYPHLLGGSIEYFFKSDEVFNELFKLLFKNSVVNVVIIRKSFDNETLPANFIKKFILELKKELMTDRLFDEIFSNNEAFLIFQGVGRDLQSIAVNSTISAQELVKISHLLSDKLESNFEYDEFFNLYKKNALNNLSQVNFIGLGIDSSIKKNRKNLQDIFVRPIFETSVRLVYKNRQEDKILSYIRKETKTIFYTRLIGYKNRLVILGNPGAGKSVLVKSLICDILNKSYTDFKSKKATELLPFRIELRKYLAFKKENKGNIIKYLLFVLDTEYLITNLTEHTLNEILNDRPCILFFDGLDEIFDISDKIETKTDIENFHNKYPKINSLVTSRFIGYEEAGLNESFTELRITNFNDNQIDEYVNKWYKKEEENEEIRAREVNDFLSKRHEIDSELITNPLLLSLIVIIYRNILKLPESKLEIYQSCTKTLVDKWEASKDLKIDLNNDIYKNKDKIFADLAHWQYEHLSSKSLKITYEKAKNTVSKSLIRISLSDEENSDDLAETFMNYALRRSIYFDNNFTHKTFLEYYTAYWIYSNVEKKHNVEERNNIITKYISNPFWFIVLELLLNLIDKDQADNEVIDAIIKTQSSNGNKSIPFLLTVILKLKNISPITIVDTVEFAIIYLLDPDYSIAKTSEEAQLYSSLESFMAQNETARAILISRFKELEQRFIDNEDALITLYTLYLELNNGFRSPSRPPKFELDNEVTYKSLCLKNQYLFVLNNVALPKSDKAFLDNSILYVKTFGKQNLFTIHTSKYDDHASLPYFYFVIYRLIRTYDINQLTRYLDKLQQAGLSKAYLFNKIASPKGLIHFNHEGIIKVISLIEESDDLMTTKILLIMLKVVLLNYHFSDREKSLAEINETVANYQKKEILSFMLQPAINIKDSVKLIRAFKI